MNTHFSVVCMLFVGLFGIQTVAQTPKPYPDTMWIPVIFYDYWVDDHRTNPDFEIAQSSNTRGMVRDTLDLQRKPIPTSIACPSPNPDPPMACNLFEWFRVSGVDTSDFTCAFQCSTSVANPNKQYFYWTGLVPYPGGTHGELVGPHYSATYNMRNIVVYDSLPFLHLGNTNPALQGVYEYKNDEFFKLDGKGFGMQPEGSGHNFGFTMELHMRFQYKKGITFNFTGDDDVWAFVNHRLVMDLGGKHWSESGSFNLDSAKGLTVGATYDFDFFYAERHTSQSTIKITTNILTQPNKLLAVTADTIVAGDTANVIGKIFDQANVVMPGPSDSITWSFLDTSALQPGDKLFGSPNDTVKFTGTIAYHSVLILAKYTYGIITLLDTVSIYIKPGPPDSLTIKATADTIVAGDTASVIGKIFDNWKNYLAGPSDAISWSFLDSSKLQPGDKLFGSPNDTVKFTGTVANHGVLILAKYTQGSIVLKDTVEVYIKSGPPDSLTIKATADTIVAGDTASVIGKIFDSWKNYLPVPSDSISWSFLDSAKLKPGDKLFGSPNDTVKFTGTVAFHSVQILAKYTYGTTVLLDTAEVYIKSGAPFQVDIVLQSLAALTAAQVTGAVSASTDTVPRLTIAFDSMLTSTYAYAVLRDKHNNYSKLADSADWKSLNTDTATDTATAGKLFESLVKRTPGARKGTTFIVAASRGMKPDTAAVVLRPDFLKGLMLVDSAHPTVALDTLKMTTSETITILVKGKWSTDTATWVDVSGIWVTDPPNSLPSITPLPTADAAKWHFDPTKPDTAKLIVTALGLHVDLPVLVGDALPNKLKLVLLTNPDSCFAGKPLQLAAFIENSDGLLYDPFTGQSTYHDLLDNSPRPDHLPWMSVNPPAKDSLDKPFSQTWLMGTDTFQLTLYYAPLSKDSLHRIQLSLATGAGTLTAMTIPFRLRPGPIDSLQIEDNNHKHILDTIIIPSPNGSVHLNVAGFDEYGNYIDTTIIEGAILKHTLWKADSGLHQPKPDSGQNIYYSAKGAVYDEQGLLWAILTDGSKVVKDKVPVKIVAEGAKLDSAITIDENGNGLIDCIKLVFNKKVDIDQGANDKFKVDYLNNSFIVDSVIKLSDSTYALFIHEKPSDTVPQSSWKPLIDITNLPVVLTVTDFPATDGCPPVIWEVVKYITSPDRKDDRVKVKFSEKIMNPGGGMFGKTGDQPELTFNAWTKADSAFQLADYMFKGITAFTEKSEGDSIFFFLMSNGRDLTENHYMNIIAANRPLCDKSRNFPIEANRKVRVKVAGGEITLTIYPNPAKGSFVHPSGSKLEHQEDAEKWVYKGDGGVVICIGNVPVSLDGRIKAYLRIHDVVGNVVFGAENKDLFSGKDVSNFSGSVTNIKFYWNGSNSKGMIVSPGTYRIVVYVDFPPVEGVTDTRLIKKAGIRN